LEDFRAKTLALQEKGLDWLVPELDSSLMHSLSRRMSKQQLSSWRMSQDFYQATTDAISESSSLVWPTQGIATSNGVFLIRSSSESPNAAVESSLSQVLETEVSPKYSLSAKAAEGIIRRAERRGKTLPEPLKKALQSIVKKPE
jgi:hypothetical protein